MFGKSNCKLILSVPVKAIFYLSTIIGWNVIKLIFEKKPRVIIGILYYY